MTRVRPIGGFALALAGLTLAVPTGLRSVGEDAFSSPTAGLVGVEPGLAGPSPLAFEVIPGQPDGGPSFSARGPDYAVTLSPGRAVVAPLTAEAEGRQRSTLRLTPRGGDPAAPPLAVERLSGVVNEALGADPSRWRSNVPTYAKAGFAGVWAGIDVLFYGNGPHLEYDFLLAAGADPSPMRMEVDGAGPLRVDDGGRLVSAGVDARIVQRPPVAYQIDGDGRRQAVQAEYVLHGSREVGFRLGLYDRSRPLVVDPVLDLSVFLGGNGFDGSYGMAVDGSGNTYVTGNTGSTDFPTTSGLDTTLDGKGDVFVTKMDARGKLVYSTYLGGTSGEIGTGIAVDSSGNAYVTGSTDSADFPTSPGLDTTLEGGLSCSPGGCSSTGDAFVTKLDAGGRLVYSTYLGGSGADYAAGIGVDATGNAYVTGMTQLGRPMGPVDFPTTPGLDQVLDGHADAFVTKLAPEGVLAYSTLLGGTDWDDGRGIAVDGAGNAYVTGNTHSVDFPTTPGLATMSNLGDQSPYADAFVTKLASNGTIVLSTYLGGRDSDLGFAIALDRSGNAYVAGASYSSDFPTTPGLDITLEQPDDPNLGGSDSFVTKLGPSGTIVYSTYLGGTGSEVARGIAVDALGRAYVTGDTESHDFPTTRGADASFGGGDGDAFVTMLAPEGTRSYSTYLGGSGDDVASAIGVDLLGNAYVSGYTSSARLGAGPSRGRLNGERDAFVATISSNTMACKGPARQEGRRCR